MSAEILAFMRRNGRRVRVPEEAPSGGRRTSYHVSDIPFGPFKRVPFKALLPEAVGRQIDDELRDGVARACAGRATPERAGGAFPATNPAPPARENFAARRDEALPRVAHPRMCGASEALIGVSSPKLEREPEPSGSLADPAPAPFSGGRG